jgi:hypothetical protein
MTQQPQQLKFGDLVRCKQTGQKGSVIDFKFGVVVALHGDTHIDTFDYNEIERIPHPDTVRLDWLADPANKIGNVILPTECVEQHLDSMRDAIDAAMRIQAAEAV